MHETKRVAQGVEYSPSNSSSSSSAERAMAGLLSVPHTDISVVNPTSANLEEWSVFVNPTSADFKRCQKQPKARLAAVCIVYDCYVRTSSPWLL